MIKRAPAYWATDGQAFKDLAECQNHELGLLLREGNAPDATCSTCDGLASWLIQNKERLLDILTTTPTSKPTARKINGGKKVRKPKQQPQPSLPLIHEGNSR